MTILSLILIGLLIIWQIWGFYSCWKKAKYSKEEETDAELFFKTIGYFSSCLTFLIYFVGLFVSAFAIHSKIAILLIVIYILTEFLLMCIRFKKTQESANWEDMENKFYGEGKSWKYLVPEVIKTGFLIYLFVMLALQV